LHKKQADFAKGKGGADALPFDQELYAFVTPFVPSYANNKGPLKKTVDYTHEREWRVPSDFAFALADVEFVVLSTYEDVAKFPKTLKDGIGRDRFLMMDVYEEIQRLWPVGGG
jgi:hypothetical protein